MKLLKIASQGFIEITSTEEVSYNRAAIMKEGWRLKKAGHEDGIAQAWKAAKAQKDNIKALIEETAQERADYIEMYELATEAAEDFIGDYKEGKLEGVSTAMYDAIHDFYEMNIAPFLPFVEEEEKEEQRMWDELEKQVRAEAFKKEQARRLKRLLGEEI